MQIKKNPLPPPTHPPPCFSLLSLNSFPSLIFFPPPSLLPLMCSSWNSLTPSVSLDLRCRWPGCVPSDRSLLTLPSSGSKTKGDNAVAVRTAAPKRKLLPAQRALTLILLATPATSTQRNISHLLSSFCWGAADFLWQMQKIRCRLFSSGSVDSDWKKIPVRI